ncbi:MAG: hypothetical protein JXR65_02385 [Bacteroidales bacterium]|nr:hypothetical protein [Bacteroidales bacterium]
MKAKSFTSIKFQQGLFSNQRNQTRRNNPNNLMTGSPELSANWMNRSNFFDS